MFCTQCGIESPARANFCPKCGTALWADTKPFGVAGAQTPNPVTAAPSKSPEEAGGTMDPKQVGVFGWLRFMCVSLGVLSPLFILATIRSEYEQLAPLYGQFPQFRTLFAIESTVSLLIGVLAILTAIALWRRYSGAVAVAKTFLVSTVLLALLEVAAFSAISDLPPEVMRIIHQEGLSLVARAFGSCMLWYCYLQFSSRVRLTYAPGSAAGPLRQWNVSPVALAAALAAGTIVAYQVFLNL